MTAWNGLAKLALPLLVGIWIGWALGAAQVPPPPGEPEIRIAQPARTETPPVGTSSEWGQHTPRSAGGGGRATARIGPNVHTDFNPDIESPRVHETAFLDPTSSVIGNVEIGAGVFLAPFASVRGDEGQPIHIGAGSNLQDGVVIHALETVSKGQWIEENSYTVDGKRYAVHIGQRVSVAHQSHVHGPAWIEDDVFVGMQAMVFRAHVGSGVVIEPAATIIGVTIPPKRYVPAGAVITTQAAADRLPEITYSYGLRSLNAAVVHVNQSLATGYASEAPASPRR